MKFLATLAAAASFTAAAHAQDCLYMGGTANVVYTSPTEGIAAMTGSFDGGASARVTSDRV
ncbi:MAG: hypothetical protein AAFQ67_02410, partial [Pseudomonadota bacterium]